MNTQPLTISKMVYPGETYDWSVVIQAPTEFRIHSTVFRMKTP